MFALCKLNFRLNFAGLGCFATPPARHLQELCTGMGILLSQPIGDFDRTAWFYILLILLASPLLWLLMGATGIFRMRKAFHKSKVFCWNLRHIALKEMPYLLTYKSERLHLWGWVPDRGAWFERQRGAIVGWLVEEMVWLKRCFRKMNLIVSQRRNEKENSSEA